MSNECDDYEPIKDFLKSKKDLIENYIKEINKRNTIENNLFSSISDSYKNENYTSDILRFILDPNAINDIYLKKFLYFIELRKDQIDSFLSDKKNIEVLREKHRIDILIRNNKQKTAIIIESKLNDAKDQPMQLLRYYKKITKEDHYNVLKIVYLTINPKNPQYTFFEGYDITKNEFENYKKEVNSLLFKIFIGSGETSDEFHNFKDYLTLPTVSKSDLIKQYHDLLNKIGGEATVTEKKLVNEIFSNKCDIENASSFSNLWKKHAQTLVDIFYDSFPKYDKSFGKKNENGCLYTKEEISNGIQLFICPLSDNKENFYVQIGFHAKTKSAFTSKKNELYGILQSTFIEMNLEIDLDYNTICRGNEWYYLEYTYDKTITLTDYLNNVKEIVEKIRAKSREIN